MRVYGIIALLNIKTAYKCFQCNSPLILVSKETMQPEGSLYQQTNSVYRCSNEKCQKEKDEEKARRIQQMQNKAVLDKRRIDKIHEKRKLSQKLKAEQQ